MAEGLRRTIEAECEGFSPDPEASRKRRKIAMRDFAFFRRTYFPHYVRFGDSVLHTWLDETLPALVNHPEGQRLAVAAPRGEAKSTLVSLIFVLWCVVTGRKRYIPLIADAFEQAAATLLEPIKAELEANPRLAMDFPEACGPGRLWNVGVAITAGNVKLQAFGSGKRMRGLRHGPHRPDLVICDDLENDENVRSPEQRDKLESWLKRTVLNLSGAGDTMDVILVGTVLHYDSVLARLLGNKLWRSHKFKAVIEWPHRLDLWDRWEEILLAEGEEAARAFYVERSTAMEEGSVVSWPSARPLYKLMLKRARDGHAAFDSEQQNDPLAGEGAPFSACITFWVEHRDDWLFFGAVDPSLGKSGSGRDPSAILVGGYSRERAVLDVVEASIRKRVPDRIIEDVLAFHAQYRCLLWAVETVQFQEFLRTELIRRAVERKLVIPARGVTPIADKALRIEAMQPYFAQGRIRVHPSQRTLVEQLKHFPKADHDDGPDALEMLWQAATMGFTVMEFTPVPKTGGRGMIRRGHDDFDDD
ncbi:MAG: phage terminase large subunit [Desulfovibrio sp.]|nr:phage terminase large subunit [Desulfovibrio sp.]MBI4960407.1 phage terminase large subunit [Desulfovibrio sp.]